MKGHGREENGSSDEDGKIARGEHFGERGGEGECTLVNRRFVSFFF